MDFKKLSMLKMGNKGQSSIGGFLDAVIGIVVIVVYFSVYSALNKQTLDSSTLSILSIVGVVLAAALIIRLILRGFTAG